MKGPTRDLGPAIAVWGPDTIEQTFDQIRWNLEGSMAEVKEALYGNTPVDSVFLGYTACNVTIPATRIALATLATLLPGGTNSGGASGYVGVKAGSGIVGVGRSMYDNGKPLFIKPIVDGVAADNGYWLRLEHAYPVPNFEVMFDVNNQRVYGLTFHAHPDATSKLLWSMGTVATGATY